MIQRITTFPLDGSYQQTHLMGHLDRATLCGESLSEEDKVRLYRKLPEIAMYNKRINCPKCINLIAIVEQHLYDLRK